MNPLGLLSSRPDMSKAPLAGSHNDWGGASDAYICTREHAGLMQTHWSRYREPAALWQHCGEWMSQAGRWNPWWWVHDSTLPTYRSRQFCKRWHTGHVGHEKSSRLCTDIPSGFCGPGEPLAQLIVVLIRSTSVTHQENISGLNRSQVHPSSIVPHHQAAVSPTLYQQPNPLPTQ